MIRSGSTDRAAAQHKLEIQEYGCYWAGADALAHSNAPRCRSPLGRRNDIGPWLISPPQDWAEESARFRLPAARRHGGRSLVEESGCGSLALPHMTEAPS